MSLEGCLEAQRMEGGKCSSPNNGPPGDGHVLTPGSHAYVLVDGQRDYSPEGITLRFLR